MSNNSGYPNRRANGRYPTLATVLAGLLLSSTTVLGEHYSFINYGPNEGLNAAVKQVVQDGVGFLWVGTSNGLFRYDGNHFQRFGPAEGLPSTSIRALHKAADGTIWAITGGGLVHFDGERFEAVDTGVPSENLGAAMDSDGGGQFFLASQSGVLTGGRDGGNGRYAFHLLPGVPNAPVSGVYGPT